jgi:hypothetical protein
MVRLSGDGLGGLVKVSPAPAAAPASVPAVKQ